MALIGQIYYPENGQNPATYNAGFEDNATILNASLTELHLTIPPLGAVNVTGIAGMGQSNNSFITTVAEAYVGTQMSQMSFGGASSTTVLLGANIFTTTASISFGFSFTNGSAVDETQITIKAIGNTDITQLTAVEV